MWIISLDLFIIAIFYFIYLWHMSSIFPMSYFTEPFVNYYFIPCLCVFKLSFFLVALDISHQTSTPPLDKHSALFPFVILRQGFTKQYSYFMSLQSSCFNIPRSYNYKPMQQFLLTSSFYFYKVYSDNQNILSKTPL